MAKIYCPFVYLDYNVTTEILSKQNVWVVNDFYDKLIYSDPL